jgi:hypothetical protein
MKNKTHKTQFVSPIFFLSIRTQFVNEKATKYWAPMYKKAHMFVFDKYFKI